MARSSWLALLILASPAPLLAQQGSTASAAAASPTQPSATATPSTQAIEDARAVLLAMGVDQVIGRMAETVGPQASAALLAEVRQLPDGEAMLAAWDRDYPGGRLGFAQRYRDILIDKFREGRLLFIDHMSIILAGLNSADDLHFARLTLLDANGAMKTGEALAAARSTLASNGTAQRLAATQTEVTTEMSRFGRELGEGFGVEAYQQALSEARTRRPGAPTSP